MVSDIICSRRVVEGMVSQESIGSIVRITKRGIEECIAKVSSHERIVEPFHLPTPRLSMYKDVSTKPSCHERFVTDARN